VRLTRNSVIAEIARITMTSVSR